MHYINSNQFSASVIPFGIFKLFIKLNKDELWMNISDIVDECIIPIINQHSIPVQLCMLLLYEYSVHVLFIEYIPYCRNSSKIKFQIRMEAKLTHKYTNVHFPDFPKPSPLANRWVQACAFKEIVHMSIGKSNMRKCGYQ